MNIVFGSLPQLQLKRLQITRQHHTPHDSQHQSQSNTQTPKKNLPQPGQSALKQSIFARILLLLLLGTLKPWLGINKQYLPNRFQQRCQKSQTQSEETRETGETGDQRPETEGQRRPEEGGAKSGARCVSGKAPSL